ncbi:MAG: hypothetical protein AB7L66_17110 [Gemmatimonadales bacterium]
MTPVPVGVGPDEIADFAGRGRGEDEAWLDVLVRGGGCLAGAAGEGSRERKDAETWEDLVGHEVSRLMDEATGRAR